MYIYTQTVPSNKATTNTSIHIYIYIYVYMCRYGKYVNLDPSAYAPTYMDGCWGGPGLICRPLHLVTCVPYYIMKF